MYNGIALIAFSLAFSAANFSGSHHCKLLQTDQLCENGGKKHSIIGGIGNCGCPFICPLNDGIQSVSKLFVLQFRITSRSA